MNTQLIMVEGLPGFGKSTTANLLYDILTELNIDAELFLEGNLDHPADYDGVSRFNKVEFENLLRNSVMFKEVINKNVMKKGNNYLLPYRKIKNEYGYNFPDSLLNSTFQNDIYELPLEKHIELITEKWRDFADKALYGNKIYIFECCFIQNPLTTAMIRHGEQKENVVSYVRALERIIEKLNPVLFYIEQADLELSFRKIFNERSKEWSTGFIEYYTNHGYGKINGYSGVEGTIKVLEARREIEREIFEMLCINKTKLDNSLYETAKYKSIIKEKLGLFEVIDYI
ncbi:hypothetical protein SH601_09360 [Gracilibacillus sp. S3-1-1]|uniref:Uncharacterized protein n=1 Tax=Gracilibacillus pellucidus TaxID=3095368 RepID=A0ACC6M5Z9_9BACI|nr:hypothetical protein [Gracilibacillus sp. S3-1-1]MDX8046197.1 hypothetical protein [Gracilibacillus sp. S3-1-1]